MAIVVSTEGPEPFRQRSGSLGRTLFLCHPKSRYMSLSGACLAIFVVSLLKGRNFSAMSPRKSNSSLDSRFTLDLWLFCARNVIRFSSTPAEPRTDHFHKIRIRMVLPTIFGRMRLLSWFFAGYMCVVLHLATVRAFAFSPLHFCWGWPGKGLGIVFFLFFHCAARPQRRQVLRLVLPYYCLFLWARVGPHLSLSLSLCQFLSLSLLLSPATLWEWMGYGDYRRETCLVKNSLWGTCIQTSLSS